MAWETNTGAPKRGIMLKKGRHRRCRLADAGGEQLVVIENQLESTDHDHLGKLITYLSNLNASVAIWVTSLPRPEHEQAIHWLNEWLPKNIAFYLVKVEAVSIAGTEHAAPLFTVVAGPSKAAREAGKAKKEMAERHILRQDFWTQLLARAKDKSRLHASASPTTDNWISAGAGRSGLSFNYVVRFHDARVELYIDGATAAENKRIFDALYAEKSAIENSFGTTLVWQRLDDRKASRISHVLADGGLMDQDQWPQIHDNMIDAMVRLETAFRPRIHILTRS